MLIPHERTVLGALTLTRPSSLLGRTGAHNKVRVFNSGDPVAIHWNLLLVCVELVQVDSIVIDSPLRHLLLSDLRQVDIIVKLGLFYGNLNVGGLKVQALIKRVSEFGILLKAGVTNTTRTMLSAWQAQHGIVRVATGCRGWRSLLFLRADLYSWQELIVVGLLSRLHAVLSSRNHRLLFLLLCVGTTLTVILLRVQEI